MLGAIELEEDKMTARIQIDAGDSEFLLAVCMCPKSRWVRRGWAVDSGLLRT